MCDGFSNEVKSLWLHFCGFLKVKDKKVVVERDSQLCGFRDTTKCVSG